MVCERNKLQGMPSIDSQIDGCLMWTNVPIVSVSFPILNDTTPNVSLSPVHSRLSARSQPLQDAGALQSVKEKRTRRSVEQPKLAVIGLNLSGMLLPIAGMLRWQRIHKNSL